MPTDDLNDAIAANAAGPAKVTGDEGSVEQHRLKDQIEADRYLANKAAASSGKTPIKVFRFRFFGANG